ncbi:LysR substrate-binding domain-containing protein [Rhodococcus sp. NPDC057529]|uniref:LysR substrate-binding domain-containing protein n=1 Tax=Rhodococcus sp. NPDC057529 TaxID=3346158 RepID=UPI00366FB36E
MDTQRTSDAERRPQLSRTSKSYTLVQLRYFCAVARIGSMTAAASELSTSQSTLSSAITHLEHTLGVQLFERTPRRTLEVTPAGRRLLNEALHLLEDADRLLVTARGDIDDLAGELVVGLFAPLASFRAPLILSAFERTHPAVSMSFLEGDQESVRQALLRGRCDVALMYDVGLGPGFTTETVDRIFPHIVVSTNHRFANRTDGVSLEELADDPLILLDLPHTRDYYMGLFDSVGITPNIRFRISSYETVRSFVACDHGYSLLNQRLPHNRTHAGLDIVRVPIREELPGISVLVVHAHGARPTRKALAFEDVCRTLYAEQTRTSDGSIEWPAHGDPANRLSR